jgi:hypothetical protein
LDYGNVTLWFAKNDKNETVTIDKIDVDKIYTCPICASVVKPRALSSNNITPHFVHEDASKCSNETLIHWWFKHKYLETGDTFTVNAASAQEYICKKIDTEQEYKTPYGIYRPDITLETNCGETIYVEIAFKSKKKMKDYIDKWEFLNKTIVEVDISNLASFNDKPIFRSLFYEGKIFNKEDSAAYAPIKTYKDEITERLEVTEDMKRNLEDLEWFWKQLALYRSSEWDLDDVVNAIDAVDDQPREIVRRSLRTRSCVSIYNAYMLNKLSIIKEIHDELVNSSPYANLIKRNFFSIHKYVKNTAKSAGTIVYSVNKYLKTRIINPFEYNQEAFSQKVKEIISTQINEEVKELMFENLAIENAVDEINNEHAGKYRLFLIKHSPTLELKINVFKLGNSVQKWELIIPDVDVTRTDLDYFKDVVMSNFNDITNQFTLLKNADEIIATLNTFKKRYLNKFIVTISIKSENECHFTIGKDRFYIVNDKLYAGTFPEGDAGIRVRDTEEFYRYIKSFIIKKLKNKSEVSI